MADFAWAVSQIGGWVEFNYSDAIGCGNKVNSVLLLMFHPPEGFSRHSPHSPPPPAWSKQKKKKKKPRERIETYKHFPSL